MNKTIISLCLLLLGPSSILAQEATDATQRLRNQNAQFTARIIKVADNVYVAVAQSFHASLSWKVGRTDFSAGATIYDSDVEGASIATSGRTRRLYYLRLRRDLF